MVPVQWDADKSSSCPRECASAFDPPGGPHRWWNVHPSGHGEMTRGQLQDTSTGRFGNDMEMKRTPFLGDWQQLDWWVQWASYVAVNMNESKLQLFELGWGWDSYPLWRCVVRYPLSIEDDRWRVGRLFRYMEMPNAQFKWKSKDVLSHPHTSFKWSTM